MLAVYKREFRAFFTSMTGWLYLAVNLFFAAWYFRFYGMMAGYPYVSYVLNGLLLIFLFSMPVLTMRVFAEEMKLKTDQLLFTAPISPVKIIIGKYLAVLSVFAIPVLVISLFPIILGIYGDVPVTENLLAIIGYFMFGAGCIAIGVFLSSVTESPIIAAVLTISFLLVGAMIPGICNLISSTGNLFTDILSGLDITAPMNYFMYGVFYIPGIVYYISIIFIFLFLTNYVIQKRRWNINTHGFGKIFGNAFGSFLLVVIIIAINVAMTKLPENVKTIDYTYNRIYSLTDTTKAVLDKITADIKIYYLVDDSTIDNTIETTLKGIAEYSDNISITYVSPTENPSFYATYSESNLSDNSFIVVCGDKSKVVDYYNCYEITYDYDYDIYSGEYVVSDYSVTGYDGEGRVLAAISYVALEDIPKIYNIQGHDELNISDALRTRLDKANVETNTINLLTYESIPEDADLVLIIGPLSDYSEDEVSKINAYLENGGNAIFVLAYTDADELVNYYNILAPYNIDVIPGLILEQGTSFYNSQQYYLLPDILDNDITEGVYSRARNKYVYMPYCKGMSITEDYGDVDTEIFLKTTDNAIAHTDITGEADESSFDTGSYALGVYAAKNYIDATSEIVVFSSDFMFESDIDGAVNGNNYTLLINSISKLCNNDTSSVIPVKSYSYNQIIMDETFIIIYSIFLIVLIPVALIFTGLIIWNDRRKS